MADYWKSNPRKFCDVCKCWFADNRSSIEFHERGKRHQEAVRMRLADLAKRGRRDQIQQQQLDAEMQHMEKAAIAAFKKDLLSNPELARQYGVTIGRNTAAGPQPEGPALDGAPLPREEGPSLDGAPLPREEGPSLDGAPLPREEGPSLDGVPLPREEGPSLDGAPLPREEGPSLDGAPLPIQACEPAPAENSEAGKKWLEAKSDKGYSYYWNVDTGEAVWEPPDEGYVALPECAPPEPVKQEPGAGKQEPGSARQEPGSGKQEPGSARQEPGSVKQEQERDEEPPPPAEDVMGPATRPDPYGSRWETVHREPAAVVDLQLPEQRHPAVQAAPRRDKARIVFKQKTVASLGAGADETFKKRRVDGEKRRNIRQRTDD